MSLLEKLHGVRTSSSLSEAHRVIAEAWESPELLRDQTAPSLELSKIVEDIEMDQPYDYPVLLDTLVAGSKGDLVDIPDDSEFLGYGPEAQPEPEGMRTPPLLRGPQEPLDNGQLMHKDCPPVGTLIGMVVGSAGHIEPIQSIDPNLLIEKSWNSKVYDCGFEIAEWFAVSIVMLRFYPDTDYLLHFSSPPGKVTTGPAILS